MSGQLFMNRLLTTRQTATTSADKSLIEPAPVKTPAAVGKPTLRKGLPKSADRLRGKTSISAALGAAGKAKNQWDVTKDEEILDPPHSTW